MYSNGKAPDGGDLILLFAFLALVKVQLETLISQYESLLVTHIKQQERINRAIPIEKLLRPTEHYLSRSYYALLSNPLWIELTDVEETTFGASESLKG